MRKFQKVEKPDQIQPGDVIVSYTSTFIILDRLPNSFRCIRIYGDTTSHQNLDVVNRGDGQMLDIEFPIYFLARGDDLADMVKLKGGDISFEGLLSILHHKGIDI